jgi:hypothetical protein
VFTIVELRPPGPYEWTTDGQTTTVPDTNEVVVTATTPSSTQTATIHIAQVGDTWRWFTDCTR